MSELHRLGIEEAAKGLAKGEFSSVELTQAVIDRVHARDGEIGAYLTFDEEGALAAAKAADGRNYSTLDANIHYLRNVREGTIIAEASMIRRGRTSVLIEVKIRSGEGRELTRVTVTMFCIAPAAG